MADKGFDVQDLLLEKEVQLNIPPVTSCVTCNVISNHTSFCYIVDSANKMHLRVTAQPCAGVPKTLQNIAQLHIVVYDKSLFNTQVQFLTWWQRRQDPCCIEAYQKMASGHSLLPPTPLDIHDQNAAEKWKKFNLAWNSYALATELDTKLEGVQVATLLMVIGEEARDVYSTFTDWANEGDENKIALVLQKFAKYCQPQKNVRFERYRFNC